MTRETDDLIDRWILTFLELPPVADPKLMAQILAEHDDEQGRSEGSGGEGS